MNHVPLPAWVARANAEAATPMKALSVIQPWPWLMFHATPPKDVENRTWRLPQRMIGQRIAIAASARFSRSEWYKALMLIRERGVPRPIEGDGYEIPLRDELVFGAIIGTVELVDCVTEPDSPWFCGPFGFVLARPMPLREPIPCRGALGFWNVPDVIARAVREQTAESDKEVL